MGRWARIFVVAGVGATLLLAAIDSFAQVQARQRDQAQQRTQERARKHEIIPGSELMTAEEREEYRKRYATAGTDAGRERVRSDHVEAMQERARIRGLQLADPGSKEAGK